jgi:hypothetical protein
MSSRRGGDCFAFVFVLPWIPFSSSSVFALGVILVLHAYDTSIVRKVESLLQIDQ